MKYNMFLALVLLIILILFEGCYHDTITAYYDNKISYISVRKYNL